MKIGMKNFKRGRLLLGDVRFARTCVFACLRSTVKYFPYRIKACSRHNNGISSPPDIFSHLQKSPPGVLPKIKREELSLNLNLLTE
jgi:hypothetical protein